MPVDPVESRAAYLAEYRLIMAEAERLAAVAADSAELRGTDKDVEAAYRAALRARDQLLAFVSGRLRERRKGDYYDTTRSTSRLSPTTSWSSSVPNRS